MLDLGCGFGWFCRWAREAGAAQVQGIDVSEKMLARARADTADAAITYTRADLERLELPAGVVRPRLQLARPALHRATSTGCCRKCTARWCPAAAWSSRSSIPIYTAPAAPGLVDRCRGRKTWPVDGYLEEGPRTTDWLAKGVIKQHRTLATYLNLLLRLGFTLTHVEEWGPTDAQIVARPSLADRAPAPAVPARGRPALTFQA